MKCPQPEILFEFISIPGEMSLIKRLQIQAHSVFCSHCQEKLSSLQANWDKYLAPQPDVTSSIMKVYSRLQKDETLILKGWKIGDVAPRRNMSTVLFKEGWLFRGAIGMGLAAAIALVMFNQVQMDNRTPETPVASSTRHTPLAQIRVEGKNNVRVHYIEPELLQTVEFETTSSR